MSEHGLHPNNERERRQVTVLFGDISGFTNMSEKMDSEDLTAIINDCFSLMGAIVQKNQGTVDKFMGDCIMAIFGVPQAIEEAPQKAVNAAIEMRNAINHFSSVRKLKIPLDLHIGINTGPVIAGLVGSDDKKEFTVMGDTVNIASRLKDISKKGQIFVGHTTYNQTKLDFQFQKLGPISIRGKEEPFPVFEVLSVRQHIYRPNIGNDRTIQSEMIGRDRQLDQLLLRLLKVVNGEGGIINIIGEAGIGKSRIIAELQRREETKRTTFLIGRSLSLGRNLSFHPIIDIIKNWAGIVEDDSSSQAYHKLEIAVKTLVPDNFNKVFPFVAKLMGMRLLEKNAESVRGIEGDTLERMILKSLKELLGKASGNKPMVIVLEDLHWADQTSIDLLGSLYRLARNNRILFINVFRPNFEDTSEKIRNLTATKHEEISQDLFIESLEANEAEELINNLIKVKSLPGHVKEQIIKRASGNPFFIEEIFRSFIDEGVIEFKNNTYELTEKIHGVHIPETINEVLMARIDTLEEKTKSLLKVAAVIGRNFYYKILTQVAQTNEQIDDKLVYLEGIQLIRKREKRAEIEYLFKHALAQEAAYESILLGKRRELHIQTALAIESVFSSRLHEFYGMLALHYSKGEDLDKAEEYLIKSGEEALKASASSEAINYFQEALNIYKRKHGVNADPFKISMLEKNIGFALHNKGRLAEAILYFDKVLDFHGIRISHNSGLRKLKTLIGIFHVIVGIYVPSLKWKKQPAPLEVELIKLFFIKLNDIAVIHPQRAVPEAFSFYQSLTRFNLSKISGGVAMFCGASVVSSFGGVSFRLSRRLLDAVKNQLESSDLRSRIYYEFAEVLYCYLSGNWDKAKPFSTSLADSALSVGEVLFTTYYLDISALLNMDLGNYGVTHDIVRMLEESGDKFEHDFTIGLSHKNKTKMLMKFGEFDKAMKSSEQELEFLTKINDQVQLFKGYSVRAKIQVILNDLKGAEESLQKAYKIKLTRAVPLFKMDLLLSQLIFDISSLTNELKNHRALSKTLKSRAYRNARECLRLSRKVARDRVETYRLFGIYFWLVNSQKKAFYWWSRSVQEGLRLNARLELSRTYMEIGKRLSKAESIYNEFNGMRSEQYLNLAKAIFQELQMHWDLEELELPAT